MKYNHENTRSNTKNPDRFVSFRVFSWFHLEKLFRLFTYSEKFFFILKILIFLNSPACTRRIQQKKDGEL